MIEDDEGQITSPKQKVDLTNCDRESIHTLGRVQSFGALISVSPDWIINHASTNVSNFTELEASELIGKPFADCFSGSAVQDIRSKLQFLSSDDAVERLFGIELNVGQPVVDMAVHASGRSIVMEFERQETSRRTDTLSYVRPMINRVSKADSIQMLCDAACKQLRALTRFDRVMVYKFLDDDSGVVVSEAMKPGMEPFIGLRYPASDIPKQARALPTQSVADHQRCVRRGARYHSSDQSQR